MSRLNRFSILKKICLLLFGLSAVTIGSYSIFSISLFRDDKISYIRDSSRTLTKMMGEKVQSQLDIAFDAARNLFSTLKGGQSVAEREQVLKILFQTNKDLISFSLYEAAPNSATGAPTFVRLYALFNKDYLDIHKMTEEMVRAKDEPLLGRLIKNKQLSLNSKESIGYTENLDKDFFIVVTPFSVVTPATTQKKPSKKAQPNRVAAAVTTPSDPTHFAVVNISKEFIKQAMSENTTYETFLLDKAGMTVAHVDPSKHGANQSTHPVFADIKPNLREGSLEFKDSTGKSHVANYMKVGVGTDLVLISQINTETVLESLEEMKTKTLYFSLLLAGIATIIGVMFSKSLTDPLQKLKAATEELAAGNYLITPEVFTNDEVGELSDFVVSLGKKLNDREIELSKATDLASRDGMTGLHNHRYFKEQFTNHLGLALRHRHELSLIIIDVDHFKKVNDTYGHQQGDAVLKELAVILKSVMRNTDIVARYGGEEFVAILPHTDLVAAANVAEKIRVQLQAKVIPRLDGQGTMSVTSSFGVSSWITGGCTTTEQMTKIADDNLYIAKKSGRNRVVYTPPTQMAQAS